MQSFCKSCRLRILMFSTSRERSSSIMRTEARGRVEATGVGVVSGQVQFQTPSPGGTRAVGACNAPWPPRSVGTITQMAGGPPHLAVLIQVGEPQKDLICKKLVLGTYRVSGSRPRGAPSPSWQALATSTSRGDVNQGKQFL